MKCLFVLLLNFLVFSSVYAANFIYVDFDASVPGFYRFYTQEGDLGSALGAGGNLYVLTVNDIGAHPLIFGSYGTLYDNDVVTFTAD